MLFIYKNVLFILMQLSGKILQIQIHLEEWNIEVHFPSKEFPAWEYGANKVPIQERIIMYFATREMGVEMSINLFNVSSRHVNWSTNLICSKYICMGSI